MYSRIPQVAHHRSYQGLFETTETKKAKRSDLNEKQEENRKRMMDQLVAGRKRSKGEEEDSVVANTPVSVSSRSTEAVSTTSTITTQGSRSFYQPTLMRVETRNPEANTRLELAIANVLLENGLAFHTAEKKNFKHMISCAREASSNFTSAPTGTEYQVPC